MSTAVTSPSPPALSSLRTTGSADRGSLAPAPAATVPGQAPAVGTDSARAGALNEFRHGLSSGR
ncbi:hypothetical protein [Streptomyces sp. MMBL 11-1]|uniref:hypothetical protein n=1 Tax=Streptomyces sp. MMBL 11-1 TaxID=3026420 RepID=UPI002362FE27|nr:hypothetical protein [Streptomyces sp. MMBL 11-1]